MTTKNQTNGQYGEKIVSQNCICPKCKKGKTLKRLPTNFKCVDIICEFCGFLAQIKTKELKDISKPPKTLLGASWKTQDERMKAGIYFPLYIVLTNGKNHSVYYLPVECQDPSIFIPRNPLHNKAKRAGWQGFNYDFTHINPSYFIKLI